jgi:DNA-binding SARP family transcriptional activator/TolB-like protein
MLGSIGLTVADGTELDALLRQPKSLAVLAYLAMPRPGTWHRRDALLAAFWPEVAQARARTSLRNVLYTLRKHLGEGAIRVRGDDEVSVDPAALTTDVGAMLDAIDAGDHAEALARYGGELLPALYVPDAAGFSEWLDVQRNHLRELAKKSAVRACETFERSGDLPGALDSGRRAVAIDPNDEGATRRLIALLDRAGDRAQALVVYERFRRQLEEQFGVPPAAETRALVETLRTRGPAVPFSSVSADTFAATTAMPLPLPVRAVPRPRKRVWAATVFCAVVVVLGIAATLRRSNVSPAPSRRLVVLPMENATGDARLDYVAAGVAENVARRLEGVGGFTIASAARSAWPANTRRDYKTIGRSFDSNVLLKSTLVRRGDTLAIETSVVDAATSIEHNLPAERFAVTTLRDVESRIAASVAGAVFRAPLPHMPHASDRAINPESYRLTLEGWHELLDVGHLDVAGSRFIEATRIDPANARAWSGVSSVISAKLVQGQIPLDEGYELAETAAKHALGLDSLQGSALANLGMVRALRYRNLPVGLALIRRAERVDPGNPEVFMLEAALYRIGWRWDQATDAIRVARRLDPLSSRYLEREAVVQLCSGRADSAVALWNQASRLNSTIGNDPERTRALVATGRYPAGYDSARYWGERHAVGLEHERALATGSLAPLRPVLLAAFEAGDSVKGFQLLESALRTRDLVIAWLPCSKSFDEFRQTPHFKSVLARAGRSPIR